MLEQAVTRSEVPSRQTLPWGLVLRAGPLLLLLVAEVLGLTLDFDGQDLAKRPQWWAWWLGEASVLLRGGLACVAAFLLVASPRLHAIAGALARASTENRWWRRWLSLHLAAVGAFWVRHRAVVRRRCGVRLAGGRLARRRRSGPDPVAAVLGVGPLLGGPGQTGAPDADARGPGRGGGGRERAGHTDSVEPGGGCDLLVRRAAPRPRVRADRVCAVGADTGHVDVSGGDLPRMLRLRRHRPDFPVPQPLPLAVPSCAAFPARHPAAARGCGRHLAHQRPAHHNPDRHWYLDIAGRRPGWIPLPGRVALLPLGVAGFDGRGPRPPALRRGAAASVRSA